MARPTRKTKNVDYIKFEKKLNKKIKSTKNRDEKTRRKKALALYKKLGA